MHLYYRSVSQLKYRIELKTEFFSYKYGVRFSEVTLSLEKYPGCSANCTESRACFNFNQMSLETENKLVGLYCYKLYNFYEAESDING